MKVIVYPADSYACGHVRLIWPAEALKAEGLDVEIIYPGANTGIGGFVRGNHMAAVMLPEGTDVIVLQRPSQRFLAETVPLARKQGVAVVVDMDDDLARIHPRNPAFTAMHPKTNPENNWLHVVQACKDATMVTCSTPALLPRYAAHGRGRLIRNHIPARFLDIPHDYREDSFGWPGSLHSHPDDLDGAVGAIQRLVREGRRFKAVGPPEGLAEKLKVDLNAIMVTGNLPFDEWMPNVARIGVGIAPLADTTFNAAKSGLKPIELSAAGVPWVASDTPEYRRLALLCGAPVVSKPKQWYPAIRRLIDDRAYREEMGGKAREVAATLTIEAHAHLWLEAWSDALELERGRITA